MNSQCLLIVIGFLSLQSLKRCSSSEQTSDGTQQDMNSMATASTQTTDDAQSTGDRITTITADGSDSDSQHRFVRQETHRPTDDNQNTASVTDRTAFMGEPDVSDQNRHELKVMANTEGIGIEEYSTSDAITDSLASDEDNDAITSGDERFE